MSHLTMNELSGWFGLRGGDLPGVAFQNGIVSLERIRRIPGYGLAILQKYGSALPQDVYDSEWLRLKLLQEEALRGNPLAYAQNMIRDAYQEHDLFNIRAFESGVERGRAAVYLRQARAAGKVFSPVGYRTGFLSGLG